MSKEILNSVCNANNTDKYTWSMYFFKIDHRSNKQPYKFYKIRFKNDSYLLYYAKSLMNCVSKYQISLIESVQEYNGLNSKVSCDKLSLDNELISLQWDNFNLALSCATDEKIKNKMYGYVLFGLSDDDTQSSLTFIKTANPITNLTNKRSVVFSTSAENELDMFADTVCRLYLNTDIIVIDRIMYTFNHNFEPLFDIEKTMKNIKNNAIESMVSANIFSDVIVFKNYADQYKSYRTFVTLSQERLEKVKNIHDRRDISSKYKLDLDESGLFIIDSYTKAETIIDYLCLKIIEEKGTNNIFVASNLTKINHLIENENKIDQ